MKAEAIMAANPACCTPGDTLREAALLMERHDCGCLPVVEDMATKHLLGVVTDRDMALRAFGAGLGPETTVRQVMSEQLSCCAPDDDLREVQRIMAERQVRRVPVIDRNGCCVGIIAQADIARDGREVTDREVARTVGRISEPTDEGRAVAGVSIRASGLGTSTEAAPGRGSSRRAATQ